MNRSRVRLTTAAWSVTAAVVVILAGFSMSTTGIAGQSQGSPAAAPYKTWRDYGGGPDSSKYVDFTSITKANVGSLKVAWTYPAGDTLNYQMNPIIVDNVMYVLA